jgi:heptaprenylglyceryl phosphate synthase
LLVGGGLRNSEDVAKAVGSGADWIVTGTVTEDASTLDELRVRLTEIINACSA